MSEYINNEIENTNKQLLSEIQNWIKKVLLDYYKEHINDNGDLFIENQNKLLSYPFCCSVTENYFSKKPKLLIFGQEYHGSRTLTLKNNTDFEYPKEHSPKEFQDWSIAHINDMLTTPNSPFWEYIQHLSYDFSICWNNIDKVYFGKINEQYNKKNNKDEDYLKNGKLTFDAEKILSKQYNDSNKMYSLIEREIEIIKPDYILFLIGPSYYLSLATAFGKDEKTLLNYKPIIYNKNYITNITEVLKIKNDNNYIPTFWTYHPGFLKRKKIITKENFLETFKSLTNPSQ